MKKFLLGFFIFLLGIQFISAQTVTIGTETTTQYHPFNALWGYGRSASIYAATEIGTTGNITTLAWNVSTSQTTSIPVKIYLKTTTATTLTSDSWATLTSGATLVYSGNIQFNATGWKTIDITDFLYCEDNLMVLCEANYGGYGASPIPSFYYSTSTNQHQYLTADNNAPTGTGTVNSSRPNITMVLTAAASCSGTPTAGATVATPVGVCSGNPVNLTVTGSSTGCGYTYQ